MKMPEKYVVEMFVDRIAACKVYKKDEYTIGVHWNIMRVAADMKK